MQEYNPLSVIAIVLRIALYYTQFAFSDKFSALVTSGLECLPRPEKSLPQYPCEMVETGKSLLKNWRCFLATMASLLFSMYTNR